MLANHWLRVVLVLLVGGAVVAPWSTAVADDLNPPAYRGGPLSVFVHWEGDTGLPAEPEWSWADDDDPGTWLIPDMAPGYEYEPNPDGDQYYFHIPNFVDEEPLKLLRLQLTWVGTTAPPLDIQGLGFEGLASSPGVVTHTSVPRVHTQPDGGYQYFDLEFRPNPDYEFVHVQLAPGAELVQVVVDSISIPEPATLSLLALGGLALVRRRRTT